MKTKFHPFFLPLALLSTLNLQLSTAHAQGTAFTYQGQLLSGATNFSGSNVCLCFTLYGSTNSAATNGAPVAGPILETVSVNSNGLFTATLDFGSGPFTNPATLWLQTCLSPGCSTNSLVPIGLVQITPTPYAITATYATALASNAATSAATPNLIVKRDNTGSFAANNLTLNGGLTLPFPAVIYSGSNTLMIDEGSFFAGIPIGQGPPGGQDVGVGDYAMQNNTGSYNTAIGEYALQNANGSQNTAVGYKAGSAYNTTESDNIDLGYAGTATENNTIHIGTQGTQTAAFLAGVYEASPSPSGTLYPVVINANGQLGTGSAGGSGIWSVSGANVYYNAGSVGIGTASPQQSLSVVGGLNIDQASQNTGTVNSDALTFGSSSGEGIASDRGNNGTQNYDLEFYTAHNNRMEILNNGNVGIGTTSPQSALAVNGTVTATAFIGNGAGLTGISAAAQTAATTPATGYPVLNMVWIVPGTFIMGDTSSDPDYQSDEGPQTVVTLTKGFWMGQHPVTQGEYLAVTGANPSYFTGDLSRPVESVSWDDANSYCSTLTQNEQNAGRLPAGWVYRLPTEAEWEYCCRALNNSRFYFGDDPGDGNSLTNYACYAVNSGGSTQPVGKLLPNAWGLVDMAGNVWQWCQDWYGAYPGGSVTNPQGAASGSNRVLRGGSWSFDAAYCRSAQRFISIPSRGDDDFGFRVVLAPGQ